jgi:hypothetical protein
MSDPDGLERRIEAVRAATKRGESASKDASISPSIIGVRRPQSIARNARTSTEQRPVRHRTCVVSSRADAPKNSLAARLGLETLTLERAAHAQAQGCLGKSEVNG